MLSALGHGDRALRDEGLRYPCGVLKISSGGCSKLCEGNLIAEAPELIEAAALEAFGAVACLRLTPSAYKIAISSLYQPSLY
jgi:hypothetical protein